MYVFHVNDEDYKVKFGYGVLYKSDLIDRVVNVTSDANNPAESVKNVIGLTAELLLAGLQKNYSDEFGYETDEEKEKQILKVCDLIDDYEDESEVDEETGQKIHDGFTLFRDLSGELEKNGFLSKILGETEEAAKKVNATVIPMDHKRAGRKKS
ncbi:hypothetical protein [Bilifractor porci]|uniref:Uncharacterized protein n=1 Tax=Bilifractor porci TaxID=2606636 RepID=A0A7X2P7C0_9FIRM|nr:hypothetical protein [Bilifractor porci]MST81585.1 hypothetical protein [Bilifractor porci]